METKRFMRLLSIIFALVMVAGLVSPGQEVYAAGGPYNVVITGGYKYGTDQTAFSADENDTFSVHADVNAIPDGKYISSFSDEAKGFSITHPFVTMPGHDLDLEAVYADQEEMVIDLTSGEATILSSLGHECPFIDSTGNNPFYQPVGTKMDVDNDGTLDLEITNLDDVNGTTTLKCINADAATVTQAMRGYKYKFVYKLRDTAATFGVSLDTTAVTINAQEGYSDQDFSLYKDIVATNTGTGVVNYIMAGFKDTSGYEQFGLIVGGMTATVYPKEGLSAGTYTAIIVIEDFMGRFAPIEVPVTLTVTATQPPATNTEPATGGGTNQTQNSGNAAPKTGDQNNIMLWGLMLAASLLGIVISSAKTTKGN